MNQKLSFVASLLLMSCVSLSANVVAQPDSWQMSGFGQDMNLSTSSTFDENNTEIIWWYENDDWVDWYSTESKWRGFSKNTTTANTLKNMGVYSDFIKKENGYWIKAKSPIELPTYKGEFGDFNLFGLKKGWQLISFPNGLKGGEIASMLGKNSVVLPAENTSLIKSMWTYRSGKWRYNSPEAFGADLVTLYPNEAIWINSNSAIDAINITQGNQEKLLSGFVNKEFNITYQAYETSTLSQTTDMSPTDVNVTFKLGQNGTVLSQDSEWNGAEWRVYEDINQYGYFYIKLFSNSDKRMLVKVQNNPWMYPYQQVISVNVASIVKHDNGINEYCAKNYLTSYQSMNISSTINDTNLSETMSTNVKTVADTLFALLQDGGSGDVKTQLDTMKTTLATDGSKDAKVLSALIDLIYILESDALKSVFSVNGGELSINSIMTNIANPNFEELISLKTSLTDKSAKLDAIFEALSARLDASALNLKDIINDSSYVFYHSASDTSLNYVDVQFIESLMMGLSANLTYFSAYQWGADSWFSVKTSGLKEYIDAEINPVGLINSGTFFVNPNSAKLSSAKAKFISFLDSYKKLLSVKGYQNKALTSLVNLENPSVGYYLNALQSNFKNPNALVQLEDQSTNSGYYAMYSNMSIENESAFVNFSALFDTPLTIADFPLATYSGTYNQATSIANFEPSDVNNNSLDVTYTTSTLPTNSNLNKFIPKVKRESIDLGSMQTTGGFVIDSYSDKKVVNEYTLQQLIDESVK